MNDSHAGPQAIDAPDTQSDANDDTVSRLLRVAGTRPAVPVDDMALAKAAAHAEWRQTVRAERQRSRFRRGGFGLLAAAALLALVLGTSRGRAWLSLDQANPVTTTVVATIEAISGMNEPVGGQRDGLKVGANVMADTWLETPAATDDATTVRVALRLANGASIRLDAGTRLQIGANDRMALERGAVYVDAGLDDATSVAVETAFGVARDIGTQFEVRLLGTSSGPTAADRLRIRVREGEVVLERKGDSVSARAGDEVAVDTDGTVVRGTVATHGDAWAWVNAIHVPFDPESHSILAFLEWMTREKGWALRFADPSLASRLDAIKPYGTLDGLTLEAAAEAWLVGAGLGYRLEDGVFVVRPGS